MAASRAAGTMSTISSYYNNININGASFAMQVVATYQFILPNYLSMSLPTPKNSSQNILLNITFDQLASYDNLVIKSLITDSSL